VRFEVTASDVNHGFAVYNDENVLLFQIQAVPDNPSHIVYTFKKPGRYQVVCLEFCGVNHHKMIGSIQVAR
jgi:cytochrome c oxidase subunit 2